MTTADKSFYMGLWNSHEHRCEICNVWLGNEPKTFNFEHLLEKAQYPQFRHNNRNVILICGNCHHLKTNGFPKPRHQELINQAKEELL